MADKETTNLLQKWEFEDSFIQHFKAQGIDKALLKCLTPDLIKELIPNVGLRMRFTMKWKEHFGTLKNEEQQNSIDSVSSSSSSSSSSESEKENFVLKKQKCFVGRDMYKRLQQSSVREILKQNEQGRMILLNYAKTKILSKHTRNILIELIVSHLLNTVNGPVNKHDFLHLARGIVEIFPSENINLYYVAPISKKDSLTRKSISVRGKLVDKYRNKLRQSKRIFKETSAATSSTDVESGSCTESINNEILETSIKWLETNQEPWDEVLSHWKATVSIRSSDIQDSNKTISEIFTKWPILNHPMGWLLIREDFKYLELCAKDAINQWPQFFQNLQTICPLDKKKSVRGQELLGILESNQSDESKAIAQLCALSYMIPPRGRVRTKKGHWKPSMIECEMSLVIHVKNAADISRMQQSQIDAMYEMNMTLQPYIIVVGSTLDNISSFFVSVDKNLYKVSSSLEAIDTCFKIFHVLNVTYPAASDHIWILIQRELYKFITKSDKCPSYIIEIITALKNIS